MHVSYQGNLCEFMCPDMCISVCEFVYLFVCEFLCCLCTCASVCVSLCVRTCASICMEVLVSMYVYLCELVYPCINRRVCLVNASFPALFCVIPNILILSWSKYCSGRRMWIIISIFSVHHSLQFRANMNWLKGYVRQLKQSCLLVDRHHHNSTKQAQTELCQAQQNQTSYWLYVSLNLQKAGP